MAKKNEALGRGLKNLLETKVQGKVPKTRKPKKVGRNIKFDAQVWVDLDKIADLDSRSTNNLVEVVMTKFRDKALEQLKDGSLRTIADILFNE